MMRSRTIWVGLILLLGYWPVAALLPPDPQFLAEHAVRLSFAACALVLYLPGALRAASTPYPTFGGQLTLGITMNLVGGSLQSGWLVLWRLAGLPAWMVQSNLSGWFLWMQILGIVLHLTAKRKRVREGVYLTNWRWISVAVVLSAVLGGYVVGVRPDARAFAEWIRPAFDDGS